MLKLAALKEREQWTVSKGHTFLPQYWFQNKVYFSSISISIRKKKFLNFNLNFNTKKWNSSISISISIPKNEFLNINFSFNTEKEFPQYQFQFQYQRNLFLDFNFNFNIPNKNPQSRFQYQYVNFPFCDINTTSISIFLQYFFNISISISIFGSISIVLLIPGVHLWSSHLSF